MTTPDATKPRGTPRDTAPPRPTPLLGVHERLGATTAPFAARPPPRRPPRHPPPPGPPPLLGVHERLGASMTSFAGWLMPLRYRSETAEHQAVRHAAGRLDASGGGLD